MPVGWIKHSVGQKVKIIPGGRFSKVYENQEGEIVDYVSKGFGHAWYEVAPDDSSLSLVWIKGKYLMPIGDREREEKFLSWWSSWKGVPEARREARRLALELLKEEDPEEWRRREEERKMRRLLSKSREAYPGLRRVAEDWDMGLEELERFLDEKDKEEDSDA